MTQREPRVSAGSLGDDCGGTHAPQQGMHLPLFPSVELGHREPASPCWCFSPSTSGQCPVSRQLLGDMAMEPACLFHAGRGSVLLTPDTQGLAQCRALGRHARMVPRQRQDRQAWGQPVWAQSWLPDFPVV